MSENPVNNEGTPRTLDFSGITVIGLPGAAGIHSLNGDFTANQFLTGFNGITVIDLGAGAHNITAAQFAPGTVGMVSDPGAAPAGNFLRADNTFGAAIVSMQGEAGDGSLTPVLTGPILLTAGSDSEAFPTPGFNVINPNPGELRIRIDPFSNGNNGVVKNPAGAAATDYLGADNTFRTIPLPGFLRNIQAGTDPGTALVIGSFTQIASVTISAIGVYALLGSCIASGTGVDLLLQLKVNGSVVAQMNVAGPQSLAARVASQVSFFDILGVGDVITLEAQDGTTNATAANTNALLCVQVSR